jgi:ubiquinone/menaquinone biosynthesis C-methylase UbiE
MKDRRFFYNEFATKFDSRMNRYDVSRRVEIVFNKLLGEEDLKNRSLLDAGCGTGWFSKRASELGADVVSLDIGKSLLNEVKKKCDSKLIVGDVLNLEFKDKSFDVVVSSEVIEHTLEPRKAVKEIVRVTKDKGIIVLTTPNKFWYFSAVLADKCNLRPYKGLENWVGYFELKKWLIQEGCTIEKHIGFHLAPIFFNRIFHPFLRYMDRFGCRIGFLMLNTAIKCRKSNHLSI